MSLTASPPPTLSVGNVDYDQVREDLDDEISNIRAQSEIQPEHLMQFADELQVQELTQRRRLISSTLLGSSKIQKHLRKVDPSTASIITKCQSDNQENIHRLAFSVTSFPYTDP